jgi:phosphoribosyl 1,2-cyclic phosphodiesterase
LASGSSGNSAFVATEKVRLLIDAGLSFREAGKRLAAIGEDIKNLDAVLISHEHSDHIVGLPQLVKKVCCPVFLTRLTEGTLSWNGAQPAVEHFEAGQTITIGDLEIDTFTIPHDAADPVAFCIRHGGIKAGVVTDLGYMTDSVKYQIRGCHWLALESNHDLEMLKVGPYPWFVKQRVMSRVGHLSNKAVSDFLTDGYDRTPQVLVLAHLSDSNNHPEVARMFAGQALETIGARETKLVIAQQSRPSEVFQF